MNCTRLESTDSTLNAAYKQAFGDHRSEHYIYQLLLKIGRLTLLPITVIRVSANNTLIVSRFSRTFRIIESCITWSFHTYTETQESSPSFNRVIESFFIERKLQKRTSSRDSLHLFCQEFLFDCSQNFVASQSVLNLILAKISKDGTHYQFKNKQDQIDSWFFFLHNEKFPSGNCNPKFICSGGDGDTDKYSTGPCIQQNSQPKQQPQYPTHNDHDSLAATPAVPTWANCKSRW